MVVDKMHTKLSDGSGSVGPSNQHDEDICSVENFEKILGKSKMISKTKTDVTEVRSETSGAFFPMAPGFFAAPDNDYEDIPILHAQMEMEASARDYEEEEARTDRDKPDKEEEYEQDLFDNVRA